MSNILETILIAFYIYILLSTISVLILENRNPVKSVAWLVILIFIPFVGLVLYLILGQDYRKRKMISRKSIQRIAMRPCAATNIKDLDTSNINIDYQKNWLIF